MRRAANENPVVQMVLIGILLAVFAFIFYTRVLSGGSAAEPAPTADSSTAAPPAASAPATPADPAAPAPAEGTVAPDAAAPAVPSAPEQGAVPPSALVPGKGLPQPVVKAYADGEVVVLLIVRRAGIEDGPVRAAVNTLRGRPDTAVFVTGAKNIARYSRVTNGVAVSRVPALIVIRPRSISGDVPEASVSYGFRSAQSVLQAVEDAVYDGPEVPYYPE